MYVRIALLCPQEVRYLQEKIAAGADFILTQFFYDVDVYLAYVQRCRDAGITCPIIPGLMPIHVRACVLCGRVKWED